MWSLCHEHLAAYDPDAVVDDVAEGKLLSLRHEVIKQVCECCHNR